MGPGLDHGPRAGPGSLAQGRACTMGPGPYCWDYCSAPSCFLIKAHVFLGECPHGAACTKKETFSDKQALCFCGPCPPGCFSQKMNFQLFAVF